MKKIVFLLPLFLLTSCGGENKPATEKELFERFGQKLVELEGHVSKTSSVLNRSIAYLTTGEPLIMEDRDTYETERYTYNSSFLVESKGTAAFIESGKISSSSKYTAQIYDDRINFYSIKVYEDPSWDNVKKSIRYSREGIDLNYNIGFALNDIQNMKVMLEMTDKSKYEYEYTNFEGNIVDNKLKYTYEVRFYEFFEGGARALSQKISYDTTLTIENNKVTKMHQVYINTLYVAEREAQTLTAVLDTTYTQGEYSEFKGTIIPF